MKKFTATTVIALIVWLIPIVYLVCIFSKLPASVPLHFSNDGTPNRMGSKFEFLGAMIFMFAITIGVYLLLIFLPSIDPKAKAKYSEDTFKKIALALVFFLSTLCVIIVYSVLNGGFKFSKIQYPLFGVFFAYLGNLMYNIKPNYFAGIRTPWTLEDEDTWKVTHRLAGKMWFAGGVAIVLLTLLSDSSFARVFFIAAIAIMALTPVVYSYVYYKKNHPKK